MEKDKDLPELLEVAEVATILMSLSLAVSAMGNSILGTDPNIDSRNLYEEVLKEIEFLKRDMK